MLERDYDLDPRAARNLLDYLREQQDATRVVPSDRTIVIERFRDEIGDWRLCVLSPYGGRVHAAWGLALSRRIREQYGLESDAIWSDDGIIVHLPDADEPPGAELVMVEPDEVEDAVVAELASSALFGARFRENAGRALLIPRAYPGKRTPLWQQRLKSQSLLEVAKRYAQFPIILETYRECLRDVLDLPGLQELLTALHRRELTVVEVETPTASPFASSLLFDYVATYMYEGDTPNAERRAAALSLDRDLLRELLGQEELRDLIDPAALDQVEADLQHRSDRTRADSRDALADVLRRLGDLTLDEVRDRVLEALDAEQLLLGLAEERRAVRLRINGEPRWIAADDAGLYRDALGAVPPGGLPEAFTADVPDALERVVSALRAHARPVHHRRAAVALRRRSDARYWRSSSATARSSAASCGPAAASANGATPTCCAGCAAPRWPCCARRSRPPTSARSPRSCPPGRASTAIRAAGAGVDRLREVLVPLQGLALPADVWERDVLPRRTGAYSPTWLDQLCASGELVWVGAGALGRNSGRVALYFRDDAELIGPPTNKADPPDMPEHDAIRERLAQSPCFFTDLLAELALSPEEIQEALWDLVWAGEATNDAFAPLRAPRLTLAKAQRAVDRSRPGRRFGARRSGAGATVQGRWSLTTTIFRSEPDPGLRRRTRAELLLERYGIVTREHVLAEGMAGGFSLLYDSFGALETLGVCRRGYFVEGLGGAQFALPGAVERLRAQKARGRGAAARPGRDRSRPALRRRAAVAQGREPATDPSARSAPPARTSSWPAASPCSTSSAAAAASSSSREPDDPRLRPSLEALAAFITSDRRRKLSLERIDGEPVVGSAWEPLLVELGFRQGPRKLTLSA